MKSESITLDYTAADAITLCNLKQQRDYLKEETFRVLKGGWVHPDDIARNKQLVQAFDQIIEYFGG